jgi:hypothetical protein
VAICRGYAHIAAIKDSSYFDTLSKSIQEGLAEKDYDSIFIYQYLIEVMISPKVDFKAKDPESQQRKQQFGQLMDIFMDAIKKNLQYYKFTESMIDYMIRLATRYPQCKAYFQSHKDVPKICTWHENNRAPPMPQMRNQPQGTLKLFKKPMNVNDINYQQQYIKYYFNRFQANSDYRIHMLQAIASGNCPDHSKELDWMTRDMFDAKFVIGQNVDQKSADKETVVSNVIENTLDELIYIRVQGGDQNSYPDWVSTYSNKLLPGGEFPALHRTQQVLNYL